MACAQLHTGTVSTIIFFWNVRSFRLVDTSKCFERICCLHLRTDVITVFIYLFLRSSFFKSLLICYLKILNLYCPFCRVPASMVFVTGCLLNSRYGGWDRPVGIVTGCRTGSSRNLVSIPGSRTTFIYSLKYLPQAWGSPCLLFSGYRGFRAARASPLMTRLRMSGPVPPLPHIRSRRAEGQLYLYPLRTLTYSEFRLVKNARTHYKVSVHVHLLRDKSNAHFIHRHVTQTHRYSR